MKMIYFLLQIIVMSNKFAVVYVVYDREDIIGAVVSAISIRKLYGKSLAFDIVLITNPEFKKDVSAFKIPIFDIINYKIELLKLESFVSKDKYEDLLLDKYLPSKFNLLKLEEYEKILYISNNCLVQEKIDDIFTIETPAFVFKDSFMKKFVGKTVNKFKPDIIINYVYSDDARGLIDGNAYLLKPNKKDFENLKLMISNYNPPASIKNDYSDESSIIEYYVYKNKLEINNLGELYQLFGASKYQPNTQAQNYKLKIFQYKPWKTKEGEYDYMKPWWKIYHEVSQ